MPFCSLYFPLCPSFSTPYFSFSSNSPTMALTIAKHKHRCLINTSLIHLFSSSSHKDDPNFPSQSPSDNQQQTLDSSFFSNIKASLKQPQRNQQSQFQPNNLDSPPHLTTPSNAYPKTWADSNLDLAGKEFGGIASIKSPVESRAAGPPNPNQQPFLFQDLYKQHIDGKLDGNSPKNTSLSFDSIKQKMRTMKPDRALNTANRSSGNFNLKPGNKSGAFKSTVIGGTQERPLKGRAAGQDNMATGFVKMYGYDELGNKLISLRPENKEKGWFSLEELNERLRKLRKKEEEDEKRHQGFSGQEIRKSLENLVRSDEEEKAKKNSLQRINVVNQVAECMAHPPKEHLVDKYFHPDNMSSAEKLKLELANVREEFKMSESDCGSARVQVAQLTTKIKHLSSVLHKKDNHSRKGLNEMVQRRKKLLKYLRRTDWDSYCFVLSKLGLRDNADMKH